MNRSKHFLSLVIVTSFVLFIILGGGYTLADWQNPEFSPPIGNGSYNADAPINTSNAPQTKNGDLGILGTLSAFRIFAIGKMGVGMGANIDPSSVLDVAGQIRIREGNPDGGSLTNKVLTAVNNEGLAIWRTPGGGITKLIEGFGIDLGSGNPPNYGAIPSDLTSEGGNCCLGWE